MKKSIQDLAYLIKTAKDDNQPKPIVFLGAGASVSAGIPLAGGIIDRILADYKDKPSIRKLSGDKRNNYFELMSALNSKERRQLFQKYIEEAKINVAHIYLAQLVKKGYVDYVLTVNFDDLLQRACGLFNYTMPAYDISNVNSFTTTTFQKSSIIYLHGQHYGEWLLNAKGELDKVKDKIQLLLNKIVHNRTWIMAGYSGEDEVFNEINKFSSFDNELYWIGYLNNRPTPKVTENLLEIPTKNAHYISGYDADTFFLDLHSELGLPTPEIIDKPFSFLESMMLDVKVPEEDFMIKEHKELYKGLSNQMGISGMWIKQAIDEIQEDDSVEKFKQRITDAYVKSEFDGNAENFLEKIKDDRFRDAKIELSDFYVTWGRKDYGANLSSANISNDNYMSSIEKFKKAIELNPKSDIAYENWGFVLYEMASKDWNEDMVMESIDKFKKVIELNPNADLSYNNWGSALLALANRKKDEKLYKESLSKYEKAVEINPNSDMAFENWGLALFNLGKMISDPQLLKESIEKFDQAESINPKIESIYSSWSAALSNYAKMDKNLSDDEVKEYFRTARDKAWSAYNIGGSAYNLACSYALLEDKENALKYLRESLDKNQVAKADVLEDEDWEVLKNDQDFIDLVDKY